MSPIVTGLWALNILVDTAGQLAFKAAAIEPKTENTFDRWLHMLGRPWIWAGVACFVVEFVLWLAFLSLVPLAQGVLLGMISIVTIMMGGRIWFREQFTRLRILGILLIVSGIAIVGST